MAKTRPRLDKSLNRIFNAIGKPEPAPFEADPFQVEAVNLIEQFDVLVSAPTGSGKTWIASRVIHSYLSKGLKTWYASPLKALSNSIYNEFCEEFGQDRCGILTGDRKENADASIIIGTTEILRNQLYDAMHQGIDVQSNLIILDEAHYLSDPFRGVVWEEVLIYLPSRIRLLLLSATISNDIEICEWLRAIRDKPNRVVRAHKRPVPLESLFLFPDGLMVPLGGKKGLNPRVKRFVNERHTGRYRRRERVKFGNIINLLREFNLLPAIFFLKSRADCDRAVFSCSPVDVSKHEKERMEASLSAFLREFPHLSGREQLRPLLMSRVGSHHGGQLPYWKVLVEKMMADGFLEAIFSTSTVAAGVNFPARTVVIVQSDRYNGREFVDLSATDLHQMIGRAGRRGKDRVGFVLILPGEHQDPELIHELIHSSPEPVMSQIHINFSMTLNLLLSHKPDNIRRLLERSLAAFQEKIRSPGMKRQWDSLMEELFQIIPEGKCDINDPKDIYENISKAKELKREIRRFGGQPLNKKKWSLYESYLEPGRLFQHKNGHLHVLLDCHKDGNRMILKAHNLNRPKGKGQKRIKPIKVHLGQIKQFYKDRIKFPNGVVNGESVKSLKGVSLSNLKPLRFHEDNYQDPEAFTTKLQKKLDSHPCNQCVHRRVCHGPKSGHFIKLLNELLEKIPQMEGMDEGLWISFKQHLRFLKETGFVDQENNLTEDGIWASKLRLDQPLLIAEAIRKGAFEGVTAEYLAGGLAPFVWDRNQEIEFRMKKMPIISELEKFFSRILASMENIVDLKTRRGFEHQPVSYWPAAALYFWAKGGSWEQLMDLFPANEGDMASLIVRTADHLRQVANLSDTHPKLASIAREAIKCILREPVYIY